MRSFNDTIAKQRDYEKVWRFKSKTEKYGGHHADVSLDNNWQRV